MTQRERFLCYLVQKDAAGEVSAAVAERTIDDLPPGEVLIDVEYSSLNYKDALSASGNPGVTKKFPHVPGIDLAGRVAASESDRFKPGDAVLATSFDIGANRWGGYAGMARVPADWIVPMPVGLSARDSMIYGTAGLTAAMSLAALEEHHITPDRGEIVVTGASGGVGALSVALLAKTGYQVTAVTGKPQAAEFLRNQCGAVNVIGRDEVNDRSGKPLLAARWAGAVDTVGGNTLATLVRSTQRGGCVTACGLVGGVDLPLSVHPFILRGVTLAGIDSAECPYERRAALWNRLAGPWKLDQLEALAEEIDLGGLHTKIAAILAGQVQGRVIVRPVVAF